MTWTHFWDMHSGGSQKEDYAHFFIEADEDEAVSVFYSRFGHSPNRVSCTCCGSDYSVTEYDSLEDATSYQRGEYTDSDLGVGLGEYLASGEAVVVPADEIADVEREVYVPREGYVWQ